MQRVYEHQGVIKWLEQPRETLESMEAALPPEPTLEEKIDAFLKKTLPVALNDQGAILEEPQRGANQKQKETPESPSRNLETSPLIC